MVWDEQDDKLHDLRGADRRECEGLPLLWGDEQAAGA